MPERAVAHIFAQALLFRKSRVRGLVTAVAIATAADIVLTDIGLQRGYLLELNPLMGYVLESGYLKVLLVPYLALCFAVLYRYAGAVRWLGSIMLAVLVIKAAVLAQHLAILINVLLP